MQAIKSMTAVFCLACVCAELAVLLAGNERTGRCIKAAAGLYILITVCRALPGSGWTDAVTFPPQENASVFQVSLEEATLRAAERNTAALLAKQIEEQTGCQTDIVLRLAAQGREVTVQRALVRLPACSEEQKRRVEEIMRLALGSAELEMAEEGSDSG